MLKIFEYEMTDGYLKCHGCRKDIAQAILRPDQSVRVVLPTYGCPL